MTRLRKVLLITNIFPPQIGGPATFISTVARKLSVEKGCRVTVICATGPAADGGDRALPYRVLRLHHRSAVQYQVLMRWTLGRELLRHNLVLVNGFENAVYPLAKALGRKYVLKVPGDSVWQMGRNTGVITLDIDQFQTDAGAQAQFAAAIARRNQIAQFARHVVTPSNYLRNMVHGWGVPLERITTISNGVELRRFTNPVNPRTPSEPLRVVYVGRLTNWKGVETALLALVQFRDAVLTVVGDGPALPFLKELAQQLKITDRVEFAGRRSPDEVARAMAVAHVLVLTSLYEGMSHTLQEGMAAALVCVASEKGGNNEVIRHGETGLLVLPQNVEALVRAWRDLYSDESGRRAMAAKARAASAEFSMDRTTEAFVSFFERMNASA